MTITLGGLALPDDSANGSMLWPDQYDWTSAVITPRRGIDGNNHVFTGTRDGGRPITLEARARVGWLTQAQVDSLYAMADAGGKYTLNWRGTSYTVRFLDPIDPQEVQPFSGLYTCTISLIEV